MRIAKATQAGRWRKVKTLQWLLTHNRAQAKKEENRLQTARMRAHGVRKLQERAKK
jgi:hypothetical protein